MRDEKSKKAKLNVLVDGDILHEFNRVAAALNFRRDSYFEDVLDGLISKHERDMTPNSPEWGGLRAALRELAPTSRMERVRLAVDAATLQRLNALCESKHFVRDQFVERAFQYAAEHLSHVKHVLEEHQSVVENDYFSDLYGTKEDVDRVVAKLLANSEKENAR